MSKVIKKALKIDKPKEKYKLSNWSSYNQSLVNRGNVTLWLSDDIKDSWYYEGQRDPGGVVRYSDLAILFCLTMRSLYGLGYRQTAGFILGLFKLIETDLEVPDYSQIHRRSCDIAIYIRIKNKSKKRLDVVLDSTGLKVYGEGEWKVRKHGVSKRRTWRKLHMCSDGEDLEIVSVGITENNVDDAQGGISLIDQVEQPINSCAGDGAYDKGKFRKCLPQNTIALIPPQRNAVVSNGEEEHLKQRDQAIATIEQVGRQQWKQQMDYHIRSLSEVNMYRYKTIFGGNLKARKPPYEENEVRVKCRILNQFVAIGMPKSYKVGIAT